MANSANLELPLSPYVPGHYLATCGLLELLRDADPDATLHWDEHDLSPRLRTRVAEADIARGLHEVFQQAWLHLWTAESAVGSAPLARLGRRRLARQEVPLSKVPEKPGSLYELCNNGATLRLERLSTPAKRGTVLLLGSLEECRSEDLKSEWGFWSGQVTLLSILRELCGALPKLTNEEQVSLADSLLRPFRTSQRFGFDASRFQTAFNKGSNLASAEAAPVSPLVEFLSIVGLAWFPLELVNPSTSSNMPPGWPDNHLFVYHTWGRPLSVSAAPFVALHGGTGARSWQVATAKTGKVTYFRKAQPQPERSHV